MNSINQNRYSAAFWYLISFNCLSSITFGLVSSTLVLYAKAKLGLSTQAAISLSAAFLGVIYVLPIICGHFANQYGYIKSLIVGSVIGAFAFVFMLFHNSYCFYLGLATLCVATSIYYTALLVILGRLYQGNNSKRQAAFTLCYLAMNIGIFAGSACGGYLVQEISYQFAFFVSVLLSILCVVLAFASIPSINKTVFQDVKPLLSERQAWLRLIIISVALLPIAAWLLAHSTINNVLLIVMVSVVFLFIMIHAFMQKNRTVRNNLMLFSMLSLLSIGFWLLYALEPSLLTLFIQSNVDRKIHGMIIPASDFYSIESLFIIVLGVPVSCFWISLAKRKIEPSLTAKFASSLLVMGAGFVLLMLAIKINPDNSMNPLWIVGCYFLLSLAELLISPIGNAMVCELAPAKLEGTLMGFWQSISGVSAALAPFVTSMMILPSDKQSLTVSNALYAHDFSELGWATITLGVLALVTVPVGRLLMTRRRC